MGMKYLNFIYGDQSGSALASGTYLALYLPNISQNVVAWLIFFAFVYTASDRYMATYYTKWYDSLDGAKRLAFPQYCFALSHHFIVVPIGIFYILKDWSLSDDERKSYNFAQEFAFIVPICNAYLLWDFVCLIIDFMRVIKNKSITMKKEISDNLQYLGHHLLGFGLIWMALGIPNKVCRYIPHLLICESSTLCFGLVWLLKLKTKPPQSLIFILEILFILAFIATRVVNLPFVFDACQIQSRQEFPYAYVCYYPILMLQCYWLYKVFASLYKRRFKNREKKE
jgi:hypothetical protein